MNAAAGPSEVKNPKTDMTHAEMKEFIRNHFEEFVNRKNMYIGAVNFAPGFVDHGADVPPGRLPGPAGVIAYVGAALKKVSRFTGDHRRHDCRGRQSRGAQPLDGHRCAIEAAAGIFWNCDLEDLQPAHRGALGLLGECAPGAR